MSQPDAARRQSTSGAAGMGGGNDYSRQQSGVGDHSREVSMTRSGTSGDLSRASTDWSQSDWSDSDTIGTETREEKARKQAAAEAEVKAVGGGKSITFGGGVSFLINNVTGGGMVLFPQVFQQAGWVVVLLALFAITGLATACGFMIIEAMAMMPGNKRFGKRAEYTSITKYYLPHRLYVASLWFFHASLITNGISMIVQSAQVMDFTLAELFGRSCAVPQFSPSFGFGCPDPVSGSSTVFGDSMYLIPLGWFIMMLIVIPLGMVNLDDNIFVQQAGFVALISIVLVWCGIFVSRGLDAVNVPAVGSNFTTVLGVVVFNFAVITSIPSWVNEKKESVSIEKSFAVAMPLACGLFVLLGFLGAMAFPPFESGQTILVIMYGLGTKVAKITFFLFPACVNLTSIPVYSIMCRYNLIESGVCGHKMSLLIAVGIPWLVSIPLYTGSGYELLVTWSGILITSVVNFIVPPVLYILALQRTQLEAEKKAASRAVTHTHTMMAGQGGLTQAKLEAAAAAAAASSAGGSAGGSAGTSVIVVASPNSVNQREGRRESINSSGVIPTSGGGAPHRSKTSASGHGGSFASAALRLVNNQKAQLGRIDTTVLQAQKSETQMTTLSPSHKDQHSSAGQAEQEGASRTTTTVANTTTAVVSVDMPAARAQSLGRRLSLMATNATSAAKDALAKSRKARKARADREVRQARREAKKRDKMKEPEEAELAQPALRAPTPWAVPPVDASVTGRWSRRLGFQYYDRALWALMLPINLSMYYTIPHASSFVSRSSVLSPVLGVAVVSRPRMVMWMCLSAASCLAWTGGLTYLLLLCANLFTDATTFHPFLLGLYVLGSGLRLPALITEMKGYREGTGDLNRIFLNCVLQILLCVPLPWIIQHILAGDANNAVRLYSGGLTVLSLALFIMGALVVIIFRSYDWIADSKVVAPIVFMALFFFIMAGLLDYQVLLNLTPECDPETLREAAEEG